MLLKTEVNYAFFREYRYRRVVRRHLRRYYKPDAPHSVNAVPMVVCMADGRYLHGGLADRLRSFTTFYGYCKNHGIEFRLNFTFPFDLEKYLVPNEYDWRLRPGELTYNSSQAHAVYMDNTSDTGERELRFQQRITEKFLGDRRYCQHHVYSSFYYGESLFGKYFRELFKPSDVLEKMLESHKEALGEGFIAVATRFLELLGDFKEPKGGVRLSSVDADGLIEKCVERLDLIHKQYPDRRILVTSDSRRFLDAASELPYVYVVEGDISHVDVASDADHFKTFIDFLLISNAEKVYQLKTGPMYGGNFSLRAAQAGDRPFERIQF